MEYVTIQIPHLTQMLHNLPYEKKSLRFSSSYVTYSIVYCFVNQICYVHASKCAAHDKTGQYVKVPITKCGNSSKEIFNSTFLFRPEYVR